MRRHDETLREGLGWTTADGVRLRGTLWRPVHAVRGSVVVMAGIGVRQDTPGPLAEHLARRGLVTLCFDPRGVGASVRGAARHAPARLRDWGRHDLESALEQAAGYGEGGVAGAVAHSLGGVLLPLAPRSAQLDAVALLACPSPWWGHWPGRSRWRTWLQWHLTLPARVRWHGHLPAAGGVGVPLPPGVARDWARWGRHPEDVLSDLPDAAERFRAVAARVAVRAWGATDDPLAPPEAVRALADRYGAPVHLLDPHALGLDRIRHFGWFRRRLRDTVWDGVADHLLREEARP